MQSEKLEPVAVVRGDTRIALPPGVRVEADRVVLPNQRVYVHKLAPSDVIEQDSDGRIVAVRSGGSPPVVTRFVPGTASSPGDEVRGQLEGTPDIALQSGDGIELHGRVAPGEPVPGGGRVESTRWTGALVAGVVVLGLSYLPTLYVGSESPRDSDRILALPLAGPWIDLAQRPSCTPPVVPPNVKIPVDPCIEESASRAALVTTGALQALGAILTAVGLPSQSHVVEGAPGVALVPAPSGAVAIGRF
jgi:hypothetical protein